MSTGTLTKLQKHGQGEIVAISRHISSGKGLTKRQITIRIETGFTKGETGSFYFLAGHSAKLFATSLIIWQTTAIGGHNRELDGPPINMRYAVRVKYDNDRGRFAIHGDSLILIEFNFHRSTSRATSPSRRAASTLPVFRIDPSS